MPIVVNSLSYRQQLLMGSGRVVILSTSLSTVVEFKDVSRSPKKEGHDRNSFEYTWTCKCGEGTTFYQVCLIVLHAERCFCLFVTEVPNVHENIPGVFYE